MFHNPCPDHACAMPFRFPHCRECYGDMRYRLEFRQGSETHVRFANDLVKACQIMGAPLDYWLRVIRNDIQELGYSSAFGWWTVSETGK